MHLWREGRQIFFHNIIHFATAVGEKHTTAAHGCTYIFFEKKGTPTRAKQLDKDDKTTVLKIIDKMLTTKKFKEFFQKNVAML